MEQLSLLSASDSPHGNPSEVAIDPVIVQAVPGLQVVPDFVSQSEELRLLHLIDESPWINDLKRRVQHYGYRYDYQKRDLSREDFLGPMPAWARVLGERLVEAKFFATSPDQVIVNEYLPGQGIASHIDRESCFGEVVASLSLASATVMDFICGGERVGVPLPPRSLVALRGPARHVWRHGITARLTDRIDGQVLERARRVSLTFRTTLGTS